ncbi:AAA family ATPase [Mesorhizobium sp. M7A.F.Ce.TU.012.03.2.1]|uniref:AAA family ATPase n=1 Tax=Mesorhizobium sp. M7A.F.Ce.TU.012.03.2.1 TaxID=2493681 RepID=UPI0032B0187D
MRYPVLAVGKAGLGKTVALRWIADQSGAAYCEVAQHNRAIRPMFKMLHDAYGVQKDSKHTYDLAKDCMNFLGGRYGPTRPLLVDEYQNFTPTVLRSCCIFRSAAVSRCCSRVTLIG